MRESDHSISWSEVELLLKMMIPVVFKSNLSRPKTWVKKHENLKAIVTVSNVIHLFVRLPRSAECNAAVFVSWVAWRSGVLLLGGGSWELGSY